MSEIKARASSHRIAQRINDLLGEHFQLERAVNAAWRRACRSKAITISISDMIDEVVAKVGEIEDRDYLRRTFERRFALYRPRRRRLRVVQDRTQSVQDRTARSVHSEHLKGR